MCALKRKQKMSELNGSVSSNLSVPVREGSLGQTSSKESR